MIEQDRFVALSGIHDRAKSTITPDLNYYILTYGLRLSSPRRQHYPYGRCVGTVGASIHK